MSTTPKPAKGKKYCPSCKQLIAARAVVCKFCRSDALLRPARQQRNRSQQQTDKATSSRDSNPLQISSSEYGLLDSKSLTEAVLWRQQRKHTFNSRPSRCACNNWGIRTLWSRDLSAAALFQTTLTVNDAQSSLTGSIFYEAVSSYRGVVFDGPEEAPYSVIVSGACIRPFFVGNYKNEVDAACIYDAAARYFAQAAGVSCELNFPDLPETERLKYDEYFAASLSSSDQTSALLGKRALCLAHIEDTTALPIDTSSAVYGNAARFRQDAFCEDDCKKCAAVLSSAFRESEDYALDTEVTALVNKLFAVGKVVVYKLVGPASIKYVTDIAYSTYDGLEKLLFGTNSDLPSRVREMRTVQLPEELVTVVELDVESVSGASSTLTAEQGSRASSVVPFNMLVRTEPGPSSPPIHMSEQQRIQRLMQILNKRQDKWRTLRYVTERTAAGKLRRHHTTSVFRSVTHGGLQQTRRRFRAQISIPGHQKNKYVGIYYSEIVAGLKSDEALRRLLVDYPNMDPKSVECMCNFRNGVTEEDVRSVLREDSTGAVMLEDCLWFFSSEFPWQQQCNQSLADIPLNHADQAPSQELYSCLPSDSHYTYAGVIGCSPSSATAEPQFAPFLALQSNDPKLTVLIEFERQHTALQAALVHDTCIQAFTHSSKAIVNFDSKNPSSYEGLLVGI